jgi:hypothetical protein
MKVAGAVLREIFHMFFGDAVQSAAILVVVAGAAGLLALWPSQPLAAAAVLLLGSLAAVLASAWRAARARQ